MLHQLDKMEVDLSNASAAIAGELGPLARQKARKVIDEGSQIMRIEQNEEVASKLSQLQTRLQQIEELAKHRIQVGSQLLKSQVSFQMVSKIIGEFIDFKPHNLVERHS